MDSGTLSPAVAATIKTRRIQMGLSQEQLADLCGLDRTYISSIERGKRNLTLTTLEKIVPKLSLGIGEFLQMVTKYIEEK